MQIILEYLANKPGKGLITWFAGWTLSFVPDGILNTPEKMQYILMYFQTISLIIGSIAGVLTIKSLLKKQKRK